jgi:peptide/nickel transport system permease protein
MMMVWRMVERIGAALATILLVSVLIFGGVEALPGDAAEATLGVHATPALVRQTRQEFGLDRPLPARYISWLTGVLHGDLGTSLPSKAPVWGVIKDKVRNSAVLAFAAVLFLVPLSVALGVAAALWKDRWPDHAASATTLALTSTPEFVVGTVLAVVFALGLGAFPAVSIVDSSRPILSQLNLVALPCATLVLVTVAQATRMIRATTIEVLQSDYVQMATLRGTPTGRLLWRHVLPNALTPTIQILALTVGLLVGGVVVTEAVFQYPGVGLALTNAVQNRDFATVEAISLIVSATYIAVNLGADLIVIAMNPRLRRGGR